MKLGRPPKKEKFLNDLNLELMEKLKKFKGVKRIGLYGSTPRGTSVGKLELDYFLYVEKFDEQDFLEFIDEAKKITPLIEVKNRGFPYVRLILQREYKVILDLVPCVEDDTNTQRAYNYLVKVLNQDLKFKILKAKWILKRVGLYNSSSQVKGFSGYCVECLILKFDSLNNVPDDLDYLEDPVVPHRNLLASISLENLRRFQILKKRNFKSRPFKLIEPLYLIENAPLKLWYTLKKSPHVVSVVYVSGNLIFEPREYIIDSPELNYDCPYWDQREGQTLYLSTLKPRKKFSYDPLVKKYNAVKLDPIKNLNYFKTYFFFK